MYFIPLFLSLKGFVYTKYALQVIWILKGIHFSVEHHAALHFLITGILLFSRQKTKICKRFQNTENQTLEFGKKIWLQSSLSSVQLCCIQENESKNIQCARSKSLCPGAFQVKASTDDFVVF